MEFESGIPDSFPLSTWNWNPTKHVIMFPSRTRTHPLPLSFSPNLRASSSFHQCVVKPLGTSPSSRRRAPSICPSSIEPPGIPFQSLSPSTSVRHGASLTLPPLASSSSEVSQSPSNSLCPSSPSHFPLLPGAPLSSLPPLSPLVPAEKKLAQNMGGRGVVLRQCCLLLSASPFSGGARRRATALPSIILRRSKNTSCSSSGSADAGGNGRVPATPKPSLDLHIYNTMTKQKEPFRSRVPGKVGMYVCGVTSYDLSHIGHARVYVTFDVLYRYLKHLDYEVCYVRNFTDIDDKIIARANELGEDPLSLSSRYCDEFHTDMAHLHCLPPSVEPRVTDHMSKIIDMIKQILANGCAYRIDGDVYFSVDKFPAYGRLSGRRLEDNRAGERVAVDSRKQNPADFALWKSAKPGEPCWESPWGPGRPGWHIECSAMSAAYLGHAFDIHGGGVDLVFPHHENEIAQSCSACSNSRISYWMHNGFVTVDSEKMSKSLGNFFTIRQVIDQYHPLALRLFLIGTHYRSPINYSNAQLEAASDRSYYIYQTLLDCVESLSEHDESNLKDSVPKDTIDCIHKFRCDFAHSMSDDLHTPVVLAAFSEPLKTMNDLMHTRKGKKQDQRIESLFALEMEIRNVLTVLGLMPSSYSEVVQQLREKALRRAGLAEEEILRKIEERNSARKSKMYERSDEIRKELAAAGIALMDGPDGTTWRPSVPLDVQIQLASA